MLYALEHHPQVILKLIVYGEDTAELLRYGRDDRASQRIASYAQARFNRARALRERGNPEAALESYLRGLEIEPARADIQLELGRFYEELGRNEDAAAHIEQALALRPQDEDARQALLRVRQQLREDR